MAKFSPEELLCRLEWRREIRNVMGSISHDYAVKQEAEVYSRYFSKRADVCLGLNNGYYKGSAAVEGYYRALGEEIALSSRLIAQKYPDALGGKSEKELYGVGLITYLPFESQVIEIADDGQSAKGIWNVRGSACHLKSCGPVATWLFGWAAVDFVREDGEWKILNLLLAMNVNHACGTGFLDPETDYPVVEAFRAMDDFKMPEPNVKTDVMDTFYYNRPSTSSPRIPEPYETFEKTFSYGI